MYETEFSVLMVIVLGMIAGSGAGLLIGFIAGIQAPEWADMTRRNGIIIITLIIACSAIAIAALSWRFLLV
jgi:hypothetical protein